ncbi:hypothetical protein ACQY0O_004931 [Thecaphora frezii]
MASPWQPQQDGLAELLQLFRDSQVSESEVQERIASRLDAVSRIPDYANYLVLILTSMTSEELSTRSVAGLILKNHILFHNDLISPESYEYVKQAIIPALSLPEDMLRRTATQVVAMLMAILGPQAWPEGLSKLGELMGSQNFDEAEGAFSTFAKICEDIPRELEACEINGVKPLDVLVPKFLEATQHPDSRIRMHSLNCLNQFVTTGSPVLQDHIDTFIAALFKRASDEVPNVRRFVCQALVLILGARPDKLVPEMDNVVEYMLYSTQDKNDDVALEACEFWLQFAEEPSLKDNLRPYLPKVAPVLLKGMVYNEMDLLMLGGDEDDAAVPDRAEDIKPRHYGGGAHKNEHQEDADNNGAAGQGKSRAAIEAGLDDDEDDFDDLDDDDEDDDDAISDWNLRKCSAAALDVMALDFGDELLEILLPYLKERLFSQDWLQRESGILALGAIAEGCIAGITPHLPTLVPFLINSLKDPKPLVRSITCWTLGRYSSWTVATETPEHQQQYFVPAMEGLLSMVLDNNKRVQEAGCSAFATLEEEAGSSLEPFLEPVLKTLVFAFEKYQQKNLLILYDALGTLADSVGSALNQPEYVETIMPPLIAKWQSLHDTDPDLIPLLECLSSVTIAIGPGFLSYSPPVFQRCVSLVHDNLAAAEAEMSKPPADQDIPDRTFIIVALDLLSGLTQGLNTAVRDLVAGSQPSLLPLLGHCITNVDAPVRQSAYALLGDLAISCFDLLKPYLPALMPKLIEQIEPEPKMENISVCNNAAWATGEIALQYGSDPELTQWVEELIARLVRVLLSVRSVKSLSENAAVTIGRLGLVQPQLVAPHLEMFIEAWCQALWDIKDNDEKDSAFRGLCEMIQVNPNGAAKGFVYFCNAVVRWTTPSAELNEMFRKILTGFRDMAGAQWEVQKQQFPPVIVQRLADRYQL